MSQNGSYGQVFDEEDIHSQDFDDIRSWKNQEHDEEVVNEDQLPQPPIKDYQDQEDHLIKTRAIKQVQFQEQYQQQEEDDDKLSSQNDSESDISSEEQSFDETFQININIETHEKCKELIGKQRLSIPIVTKYQYSQIIGMRANQIKNGSVVFVDLPEPGQKGITAVEVAQRQFEARTMPYKLKRTHSNGDYEFWNMNELYYQLHASKSNRKLHADESMLLYNPFTFFPQKLKEN